MHPSPIKKTVLIICLVLSMINTSYSQSPDSLKLNNGQSMTGMFFGWQKGVVSFYMLDVGMVSVNMDKVNSIVGNLKKYRIVTSDRNVYYGGIKSIQEKVVHVTMDDSLVSIPFSKIVSIIPYNSNSFKPLASYVALGYSYSKSNKVGLLNLDIGFNYSFKHVNVSGAVNSMITHDNNTYNRNREYAIANGFIPISPKWEIGSRLLFQRNRLLGLDARYLAAGGIEYDAVVKQKSQVYFFSGLVTTDETLVDNTRTNRLEIPILVDIQIYNFKSSVFSMSTTQILFLGLASENRIRHDGELKLNYKLSSKLSINTYVYDNYDSSVKPSQQNIDYGWMLGLRCDL